jgi:hypothetical protein
VNAPLCFITMYCLIIFFVQLGINVFLGVFLEVRVWDNFYRVFIIRTCDSRSFLGSKGRGLYFINHYIHYLNELHKSIFRCNFSEYLDRRALGGATG